jgi:hypothetical protein
VHPGLSARRPIRMCNCYIEARIDRYNIIAPRQAHRATRVIRPRRSFGRRPRCPRQGSAAEHSALAWSPCGFARSPIGNVALDRFVSQDQGTVAGRRPEREKCVSTKFRLTKLVHFSSQVYGMASDGGKEIVLVGVKSFFHFIDAPHVFRIGREVRAVCRRYVDDGASINDGGLLGRSLRFCEEQRGRGKM